MDRTLEEQVQSAENTQEASQEDAKRFQFNGENLSDFLPNYAAAMCKSQLETYEQDGNTVPGSTKKSPNAETAKRKKKKKKPKHLNEYQCSQCPHRALSGILLKVHMKSHEQGNIFSCLFCPYTTTISRYLQCHMQSHEGEKISTCKYCPYKTASKLRLERHMKTHTGEKPFACTECAYKTAKPENLKKHMRTHKGKKTRPRTNYRNSKQEPVKRRTNPARQPSSRSHEYISTSRMDTATLNNRLEVIRSAVEGLFDKDDHEHYYAEFNRLLRLNGLDYCCFDWRSELPDPSDALVHNRESENTTNDTNTEPEAVMDATPNSDQSSRDMTLEIDGNSIIKPDQIPS